MNSLILKVKDISIFAAKISLKKMLVKQLLTQHGSVLNSVNAAWDLFELRVKILTIVSDFSVHEAEGTSGQGA